MSCDTFAQAKASLPSSDDGIPAVMNNLKDMQCHTTTAGGGGVLLWPPIIAGGGATTSVGCEQLSIMTQNVAAAQTVINCLLNIQEQHGSATTYQLNCVHVLSNGFIGDIKITQENITRINITAQMNAQTEKNIRTVATDFVKTLFSDMLHSKEGWLSSAQGQKSIQAMTAKINTQTINASIDKAIQVITNTVVQGNTLIIDLRNFMNPSMPSSGTIELTQQNVNEYRATLFMTTLISSVFDTTEGINFLTQYKAALEAEAKGIESFISALTSGLIGLVVVGALLFLLMGGVSIQTALKYILPIAMIGAIVVAIVFGLHHPPNVLVIVVSGVGAVALAVMQFFSMKRASAAEV